MAAISMPADMRDLTTAAAIQEKKKLVKLRLSHPHVPRPYRIPGGMAGAVVAAALTTGFALLATVALLWPGIGTASPDASLPTGFTGADGRLQYEATQLLPLLAFLVIGLLFYAAGRSTREHMVEVPIEVEMGVESPA